MYLQTSLALLAVLGPIFTRAAPVVDKREADVLNTFERQFAESSASMLLPRAEGSLPSGQCDLSKIVMPNSKTSHQSPSKATYSQETASPIALPPPSEGLRLSHIVIGRGTQNYTCANETAVPAAVGAVATLFNVTCLAGPYPGLLSLMPGIALKFPTPVPNNILSPANVFLSGHHFFPDATTAFFDLNTATHSYGTVGCQKVNATDAPNKPKDVPWLKLSSKSRDGCTISEVYRLNTAGGVAPATCKGMQKSFEVEYAAEYWMWDNPNLPAYS